MSSPSRAAILCLLVGGCIDAPYAEELEVRERDPAGAPGYAAVPDAEVPQPSPAPELAPEPAPELATAPTAPRIVVGPYDATGEIDGAASCPFEVKTPGFPAVSDDGTQVVTAIEDHLSASDGEDALMTVRWVDVDTDTTLQARTVFDGETIGWEREGGECRTLWRRARAEATAINAELRTSTWRPLAELPIAMHLPFEWESDPVDREHLLAIPAAERPAELAWVWGDAVVRVPGVRVLARAPARWYGRPDGMCDDLPHLRAAYGDAETGVAVVELDHQSGACMCYPPSEMHALRLPAEVFAWAAAHPFDADAGYGDEE